MLEIILQIGITAFILGACTYSVINEKRRNRQITELYNRMIKNEKGNS